MGEKRTFLEDWYNRIWMKGDAAAIHDLMAPDAVIAGLEEEPLTGPDQFRLFHSLVLGRLKGLRVDVLFSIEHGDWISAIIRYESTCAESGVHFFGRGHVMWRIIDGRLAEGHEIHDYLTVFEQVGQLPPRTLDQLLLGRRPKVA